MSRMILPVLAVLLTVVSLPPAWAADDVSEARVAKLIEQLGDESFEVREQASAELSDIGTKAFPALEDAAQEIDREVRYRARRILAEIRTRQFEQMLEEFLSGAGTGKDFPLPGWKRFRDRIGDSRPARALFVEMQRAEPDLLKTLESNLEQAGSLVYPRARQVQEMAGRGQPPQLGEIAALVFVASDPDLEVSSSTYSYVSSLLHQQVVRQAMNGGPNKPLMSKMMGQWVLRARSTWAYQSLLLAMQYGLPEGVTAAINTLNEANQASHVKQYAIMTIAKLGTKEHLPVLEKLLSDAGVLQTRTINNVKSETQVRDVALAACVYLMGKSLRDVGFNADAMPEQQFIFNPSQLSFKNDAERSEVFDKWRKLKAAESDDEEQREGE